MNLYELDWQNKIVTHENVKETPRTFTFKDGKRSRVINKDKIDRTFGKHKPEGMFTSPESLYSHHIKWHGANIEAHNMEIAKSQERIVILRGAWNIVTREEA